MFLSLPLHISLLSLIISLSLPPSSLLRFASLDMFVFLAIFLRRCAPASIQVIDQVLIADEYKMRHVVITQAYGVVYILFNIGWYYLAPEEEKLLYDIMDWENRPLVAFIYAVVCILILAPLFSFLHLHIYR